MRLLHQVEQGDSLQTSIQGVREQESRPHGGRFSAGQGADCRVKKAEPGAGRGIPDSRFSDGNRVEWRRSENLAVRWLLPGWSLSFYRRAGKIAKELKTLARYRF